MTNELNGNSCECFCHDELSELSQKGCVCKK